jgi:2-polyprenyl-3-methyl-5-hydroxy-6-metoxy-1,4-benzoquinol methylase
MNHDQPTDELRKHVRQRYADLATVVTSGHEHASCCTQSESCCGTILLELDDALGPARYEPGEIASLPVAAVVASLGCGNPVAVAELREGEKVLDLGSGGGIDVLLSAQRVGPTGFVYGVDMTDEMLDLARGAATEGIDIAAEQPKILTTAAIHASEVVITMGSTTHARTTPESATRTGFWTTRLTKRSKMSDGFAMRSDSE